MKLVAGRFVAIDVRAMMLSILMIVIVPVAAGGLVRWLFKKPMEAHKAFGPPLEGQGLDQWLPRSDPNAAPGLRMATFVPQ